MGFPPKYESVRDALLHHNPLPTLNATVQKILFEKKWLEIVSSLPFDVALATTHSRPTNEFTFCNNCKLHNHKFTIVILLSAGIVTSEVTSWTIVLLAHLALLFTHINLSLLLKLVLNLLLLLPLHLISRHLRTFT